MKVHGPLRAALLILLVLQLPTLTLAADPPAGPSFRVVWQGFDTAAFPDLAGTVSVMDAGRDVAGLSSRMFRLIEDGQEQTTLRVTRENEGAVIALLLDTSGSMRESLSTAKAAVLEFAQNLGPSDQVLLIAFDNRARLLVPLTSKRSLLAAQLVPLRADGGTALYDSIQMALDQLSGSRRRKVVVLLTDGSDQNAEGTGPGSRTSLDACLAKAVAQGTSIFTIGLGIRVERKVLSTLSESSGGQSFWAVDAGQLRSLYGEIVRYLHSLYRVYYRTQNPWQDGELRRVRLQVQDGGRFGEGVTTYWTSKNMPSLKAPPGLPSPGSSPTVPPTAVPVSAGWAVDWDGRSVLKGSLGRVRFFADSREVDPAEGWILTHPDGRAPAACLLDGMKAYLPGGRYRFLMRGRTGVEEGTLFDVVPGLETQVRWTTGDAP